MADSVKYLAKTDCLVFGKYRAAGEEFHAPEWKAAYTWPMPDFLEVIDGGTGVTAPEPKKKAKAPLALAPGVAAGSPTGPLQASGMITYLEVRESGVIRMVIEAPAGSRFRIGGMVEITELNG